MSMISFFPHAQSLPRGFRHPPWNMSEGIIYPLTITVTDLWWLHMEDIYLENFWATFLGNLPKEAYN